VDLGRRIQIWWLGSKGYALLILRVYSGSDGRETSRARGGGAGSPELCSAAALRGGSPDLA